VKVITPNGPGELLGYILNEHGEERAIVKLRYVTDVRYQRLHMFHDSVISYAETVGHPSHTPVPVRAHAALAEKYFEEQLHGSKLPDTH
jgi:hypothetical protein